MSDLKNRIRDFYESQEPPAKALAGIRAEGLVAHAQGKRRRKKVWLASLSAAAAVLLGVFVVNQIGERNSIEDRRFEIASQISGAHLRHPSGKFQFESVDFASLEATLERLNFPLSDAESAIRNRFDLAGCSYCKVVANLALHFNALDRETGQAGSLYITALNEDLDAISPGRSEKDGVEIEMWDDGARFFVFAAVVN